MSARPRSRPRYAGHLDSLALWGRYAAILALLTLTTVLLSAVVYKLFMPFGVGFPEGFFEGISLLVILVSLGGGLIEWQRLHDGGGRRVAHWLGGKRVADDPDDALQRRLLNLVDEMVQRSEQAVPAVYVMPNEDSINAFVAGWGPRDLSLCLTQGALDRLTREELRALVAHAFGRFTAAPDALGMQRLALVWSLSWLHGQGQMLMAPRPNGQAHPVSWLLGLGLRFGGWLGWVGGRTLQAASSRASVRAADAMAVQLTETRRDLGNVLRKLWHDHQMMRGRMHHPCADMMAFLAFHDPGEMPGLATHPRLADRVRLLLGQSLSPLPTSMLPADEGEPRRGLSQSPSSDAPPPLAASAPTPESQKQSRILADRDARRRIQGRVGPTEIRITVLALMMSPGNHREHKLWHRLAEDVYQPEAILNDVLDLMPTSRLPEFERLVDLVAGQPLIHKRMLVEAARDMMRADGRVSPRERLWWLVLRHRLNDKGGQALMRPITGQGQTLMDINLLEKAYVSTLTGYVARFVPEESPPGQLNEVGQMWWRAVLSRCDDTDQLHLDKAPDTDALMHALSGVQELSWMVRPLLLAAWAEEALNHSPHGLLSDDTADALRLLATLLDSPLPPMLASHYPKAA
jgi:Zn-dependent protease with chaperone function